ncbi:MAG: hypothetical protein COA45_10265 [Zetaproteobacteria bacterium]|nr:MAG: hypothetical protein COA45_10265 [Zetaproteobacteria bacterium]
MGNPICENMKTGTIGELLVQTRLLQYGVQAAPPLKDSGNDLIAILGESFRGVQVKTTKTHNLVWPDLPDHYHILALIDLFGEDNDLYLDATNVYLIPRSAVRTFPCNTDNLHPYTISQALIDQLFDNT